MCNARTIVYSLWNIYHSTTAYLFDPPCTVEVQGASMGLRQTWHYLRGNQINNSVPTEQGNRRHQTPPPVRFCPVVRQYEYTLRRRICAATWWVTLSIHLFATSSRGSVDESATGLSYWPLGLCANMTSFTKPEAHNMSQRHQKGTEPHAYKSWRSDVWFWDTSADRQGDKPITILRWKESIKNSNAKSSHKQLWFRRCNGDWSGNTKHRKSNNKAIVNCRLRPRCCYQES